VRKLENNGKNICNFEELSRLIENFVFNILVGIGSLLMTVISMYSVSG